MDQNAIVKLRELIDSASSLGIAVGNNPTVDSMGAALSLYLALSESGKSVSIACPTDILVELSSLVGIDKVTQSFEGEGNTLVVSFPYDGKNIDKGSYTVDNGYLNIIVKASEGGFTFSDKDVKYRKEGATPSVLFIIGTSRISDLGNLFDPEALKDTKIVNIDNKKENQGFGDVVLVSSDFSSVSEQVAQTLLSLGYDIGIDGAQNLLSGISFATNNFADPKTSVSAFEIAAILMKKGAVRKSATGGRDFGKTSASFFQEESEGMDDDFDIKEFTKKQFPKPQFPQKPLQKFPGQGGNQPRPMPTQSHSQQVQWQKPHQPQSAPKPTTQGDDAPSDWLTPKVYKGSTTI